MTRSLQLMSTEAEKQGAFRKGNASSALRQTLGPAVHGKSESNHYQGER
jgi:hypothetical protein